MPYKDPEKRRECNRKKNKVYREKNLEELQAKARERYARTYQPKPKKPLLTEEEKRNYQRVYREANKERCRELSRKWAQNNKERMRENTKNWQKKNPERVKELRQNYVDRNKEHVKQLAKANRDRKFTENPEKVRQARKEVREKQKARDPERYMEMRRAYIRKSSKKLVAEITEGYVAHLLSKSTGFRLRSNAIPKELIEAKRLQLMIKRELEK
jgi:hypothetical protein